ncbi:chitin deacetylase 1-like [Ylistrum balloti]|uniref:chitin deacetylase 1-like n=1 Tax=Ylistrum balloti TaxID=509963 RepID=UPI002905B62E|nr:chitin deacetylase 1-like [Ylistrum balloti]
MLCREQKPWYFIPAVIGSDNVTAMERKILCLLLVLPTVVSYCHQGVNCHLPNCFCQTYFHPLDRHIIPQMVYFGFDDGVREHALPSLDQLFGEPRKNPNGCPLSVTFYVSGDNTNYGILKDFYNRGYELAAHSVTHGHITNARRLKEEAENQRNNIVTKVPGVTKAAVTGWRSPYLLTAGDAQVDVLKDLGYTYDISLTYTKKKLDNLNPWPLTLDYGWPFKCLIPPCVNHRHPGFWEVPVNAMRDYSDEDNCAYFDTCKNETETVQETHEYIMNNFLSHYNGNKAPFGIHMHVGWFKRSENLKAMDRAIDDMLSHKGVYIINVKQVIEWMKNPKNLTELDDFHPWTCFKDREKSNTMTSSEILLLLFVVAALVLYIYIMVKWLKFRKK